MPCVGADMCRCGGMTGGPCCGPRRDLNRCSRGGMRGKCGTPGLTDLNFTIRPRTRYFDGFARPLVSRVFFFEEVEYLFGAIGGPEH